MTKLSSIPPIDEFPMDKWKLQWLGRINRNDNVQTEPTIEASLQSLEDTSKSPITVRIGVGQLPMLTIGSIWLDQKKTNTHSGEPTVRSRLIDNSFNK